MVEKKLTRNHFCWNSEIHIQLGATEFLSVEEALQRFQIDHNMYSNPQIRMGNLKLGVEVIGASNLMPKDGQGSCTPYVELQFDGQRYRTTVKEKDLNPMWNERFYFNVTNPDLLPALALEAYLYSKSSAAKTKSFLGKVRITGLSFVHHRDAAVLHYPLEKRGIFSRVSGELGLKVYLTDDPSVRLSNPLPAIDSPFARNVDPPPPAAVVNQSRGPQPTVVTATEDPKDRHTSYTFPREKQDGHVPTPVVVAAEPSPRFVADDGMMKSEHQRFRGVTVYPPLSTSYRHVDYAVKETSPFLGGGQVVGGRVLHTEQPSRTYDLVEKMQYLFVRVVKARDLPTMDVTGSLDPYVEVRVGNHKGRTRTFEKDKSPEWDEVFAFPRERLQASVLEVKVMDKDLLVDDFVGVVRFDLYDVPTRVPPDGPLAPEWYRLESKKGEKVQGEIMVAVWMGTQADEAYPTAWHSDAADQSTSSAATISQQYIRSKVYHAPRLWYVRVNVIEAQDVDAGDRTRFPDLYAKVQIGSQVLRTRAFPSQTRNPRWNEDLVLVAAEPFDDHLVVSVEDRVGPSKYEAVGRVAIHLASVERRVNDREVDTRWYGLNGDVDEPKDGRFSSRIHLRVCLDGGYHVLDESTHYSSDLRPSARQLWRPSIGLLELGIIGADGFHPQKTRDGKGVADTYCVAKYGQKWVRTRTVVDSIGPKYNEQYTWEVYDHSTVLTVGVFDDSQIGGDASNGRKDLNIGKVRIRLSTLNTGRVYTNAYPLISLHPSGVKKMGELHLAIRFSSTSYLALLGTYSRPLLPKMHYMRPLSMAQHEYTRQQAVNIVAARLGRMEPPIRREVVECMCDTASHMWSMRRSKANFYRLVAVLSGVFGLAKWFGRVCSWEQPLVTILVHVSFVVLTFLPELILPTVFFYLFAVGAKNFWYRPQHPPHMNIQVSFAENVHPDELDEEFDTLPTSRGLEVVRVRYDRLRAVGGRVQTVLGDLATQGERLQALVSWRDPRATFVFLLFCLVAGVVLYVVPLQVLVVAVGIYVMRHPRFRGRTPSGVFNFFRRLPARTDSML